jgi:hypothetical protein
MPRGIFACDSAILEMHDGARGCATQSCCEQRHAVEFVICVPVGEIF